jgi:hypothetical protein
MTRLLNLDFRNVPRPDDAYAKHQKFVEKIASADNSFFTALNDQQLTLKELSEPEASFHHRKLELADKAFDDLDHVLEYLERLIQRPDKKSLAQQLFDSFIVKLQQKCPQNLAVVLEYLKKLIQRPDKKSLAQQLFDSFIVKLQQNCPQNLAVNLRLVKLEKQALQEGIQRQLEDLPEKVKDFAQTLAGHYIHDIFDAIQDHFERLYGPDNNHRIPDLLKGLNKNASKFKALQENKKLRNLWLKDRKKNFEENKNDSKLLLRYAVLELMFNSENNYRYFSFAELVNHLKNNKS